MTYTVRITGPGIDHVALITSAEDIAAAHAVFDKIERGMGLVAAKCICDVHPWCPQHGSQSETGAKFTAESREALCTHCGKTFHEHSNFDASCATSKTKGNAGG